MGPAPVHRNQTVLAVHTGMGVLKVCKNCNSGSHVIIDSQRFVFCAPLYNARLLAELKKFDDMMSTIRDDRHRIPTEPRLTC